MYCINSFIFILSFFLPIINNTLICFPQDIIGNLCGFLVIICGIVLLNTFKDMDVSMLDLQRQWRPRRHSAKTMLNDDEEEGEEHGRIQSLPRSYGTSYNA
jgi:Protein of unknown function (DUF803).